VATAPPAASARAGPDAGAPARRLDEWDEAAIATAVALSETHDAEVVTVTVGPVDAEPAVRRALGKGADRAVRVWDDRLAGTDWHDPQVKARLLAAVVADVEPTVVVTGARSAVDGFGATGVTLAALLDYGWATRVTDVTLDPAADVAAVRRDSSGRSAELVDVELPAVLTVQSDASEPRYAGLRAVRAAHRADIEVSSLADLGVAPADVESALRVTDRTELTGDVTLFEGDAAEAATQLAAVLRANGVGP
jgi:electron transfer flavoprotein beta subunit